MSLRLVHPALLGLSDRDNLRVDHYSPPRQKDDGEDFPQILKQEPEPSLAVEMADTEFREDREDRRDRGGYRGGNKRRRDGTLGFRFRVHICQGDNERSQKR